MECAIAMKEGECKCTAAASNHDDVSNNALTVSYIYVIRYPTSITLSLMFNFRGNLFVT